MDENYEKIKGLAASGALRLYLLPSNLREGSEIVNHMLRCSPSVDGGVWAMMMYRKHGSPKIYKDIVKEYEKARKQKADGTPVGILLKDHAVFISDEIWQNLSAVSAGSFFLLRDPLTQLASITELILRDNLSVAHAVCRVNAIPYTADAEAITAAQDTLDRYAATKGYDDWEKLRGAILASGKFNELDDFFDRYFSPARHPTSSDANGLPYRYEYPFDAISQSLTMYMARMENLTTPYTVADYTALQMDSGLSKQHCADLGIIHSDKMVKGGQGWLPSDLSVLPDLGSREQNIRRKIAIGDAANSTGICAIF